MRENMDLETTPRTSGPGLMTTIQIIGIAVAATIVAVLIAALVITKDKSNAADEDAKAAPAPLPGESFLDGPPRDEFSRLGRQATPAAVPPPDKVEPIPPDAPLGLFGESPDQTADSASPGELALHWGEGESGDIDGPGEAASGEAAEETVVETAAEPAEITAEIAAEPPQSEPAVEPGAEAKLVKLSDIIVTTSNKMVDLADPEVRRMLRDLIKFEIDQAAQFKAQGQTIDAILQLTEAEKICLALDMNSQAKLIRAMIVDLQA